MMYFSAILIACFIILAVLQFYFVLSGVTSGKYLWMEYFIEYGDSFGALLAAFSLTLFLIQLRNLSEERLEVLLNAEKDRSLQIQESKLRRRIDLVRERLEFYSMLFDDFEELSDISSISEEKNLIRKRQEINRIFQENNIKNRYPRYVEANELRIFTDYFIVIYRQLDLKHMTEKQLNEVMSIINTLIYHFIDKYHELSNEYERLMNLEIN